MAPNPASKAERTNVLIFHSNLISYSETFIPAQAEQFTRFTPYYAGFGRSHGGWLPDERTFWPNVPSWRAKLREWTSIFGLLDPWWANTVRKINPALIHAHFEFAGIRILPLAERLKVPLVLTCHGVDVTDHNYQWKNRPWLGARYLRQRQRLYDKAAVSIGISRFICDQMLKRGCPPGKVRLHYIGVDTEKFRPDPSVRKEPMLLYIGRLVEKKGVPDLLRAMKQVNAKYPDIKLTLLGDGPLRERLETYAQEEKLNVEFRGIQPPEVVWQFLKSALMVCMPSVRASNGDSEGLGMVNLEAQAVGVPVIGTRHGGIPEAVEHGLTGLLSPERDPDALAENIVTLLSQPKLLETMGLAARERVTRLFDLKRQSRLLEDIYAELL